MGDGENDIERLLAVAAISTLKARYFRFLDTKDWESLRGVFAEDAVIDVTDDSGATIGGAAKFVDALRSILADVDTVHHGHMPEIEITSPTTATGVWAMEDHLRWPAAGDEPAAELHGFGHYHETYTRDAADAWHIATMSLTRLRRDTINRP